MNLLDNSGSGISLFGGPNPGHGRTHYIYAISARGFDDKSRPVKFGISIDPKKRMRELQTAHFEELILLATLMLDDFHEARRVECSLHRRLRRRYRHRSEWFEISPNEAVRRLYEAAVLDGESHSAALARTNLLFIDEPLEAFLGRT